MRNLIVLWSLFATNAFARDISGAYHGDRSVSLDDAEVAIDVSTCTRALQDLSIHPEHSIDSIFSRVSFAVHRSGEPDACGVVSPSVPALQQALAGLETYDAPLNKYQVESFLTGFLAGRLGAETCGPDVTSSLLDYCDMGPDRTVIQHDHDKLIHVPNGNTMSLPCRFYTREGLRITSLTLLKELAEKAAQKMRDCPDETCAFAAIDLYAVPAGRMFMFAPSYVGEIFELNHVKDSVGTVITMKTLSLEPRVFDIDNFFTMEEADQLLVKALGETSETHRFHRSTTGTSGASIFSKRTSENAWDTQGSTAQKIKRRCFSFLGIDEYVESMSDGLQILRYNLTTAYTSHYDYLEDKANKEIYDYDSSKKGGNRFATILLYFSDLPEGGGGETVFPRAWPTELPEEERIQLPEAIKQLRASGDADMLTPGSWEEEMVAMCRTRLSIKPSKTRAVLFYSQHPNGTLDTSSFHGGCPVLKGTKLAANLWTWSGIRPEYEGAPTKREKTPEEIEEAASRTRKVLATFHNSGKDPRFDETTKVYFEDHGFFGNLGPNDPPVSVNTFKTHIWNIKVNGETLKTFVITGANEKEEFFV